MHQSNPKKLEQKLQDATTSEGWVVAGSYINFCQSVFWPRLDTVIWLNLPVYQLVQRVVCRSWQRWYTTELLWGTNYESFPKTMMVWRKESLLRWIIYQHHSKRRKMVASMKQSSWQHIQFIHIKSTPNLTKLFF